MSEAEIHYLVPGSPQHQSDAEHILMAIGAYQNELPFNVIHTAEIAENAKKSVLLKLRKTSLQPRYDHDLLEETEKMRKGVESHFSDDDRERLSSLFAGIATRGSIEIEKP